VRRSITVALSLGLAALCLAAGTTAVVGGCGARDGFDASEQDAGAARTLAAAKQGFAAAADALRGRRHDAYTASLPASGAARRDLDRLYRVLSGLPWRSFALEVTPSDAGEGLYRITAIGQLGAAGPPDRIVAARQYELRASDAGVRVVADRTPPRLRRRYLMALHEPVALQRPGLIVLADRRQRARAAAVMDAARAGRPRLARLGADTRRTVLVTVYSTVEDARAALDVTANSARLVFFAHPAPRVSSEVYAICDVGVMAPWLRDAGGGMPAALAHELAHAYTVRWFAKAPDVPALLVEGLAQAAEGGAPIYLREEIATGNQLWPLPESFAEHDLWEGNSGAQVALGYEVGGSLVDYVLVTWGAKRLRPFVQSAAAADPSEAGMDAALAVSLGVTWRDFYDGWQTYAGAQR